MALKKNTAGKKTHKPNQTGHTVAMPFYSLYSYCLLTAQCRPDSLATPEPWPSVLLIDHQEWHAGYLKIGLEAGQEAKKVVWQPHQNPSTISQPFYLSRDLVRVKRARRVQSEVQEQCRCSSNDLRAPRHITHPLSAVTSFQKEQWNTAGSKHWKGV